MVTIRPVLMGIREVNDWGQPGEQMKESPVSLSQHSVHSWGLHAGGGKGDIAFLNGFTIFNLEFREGRNTSLVPGLRSGYQEETDLLQLLFFFYYCNQLEDNTSHKHHCSFSENGKTKLNNIYIFFFATVLDNVDIYM